MTRNKQVWNHIVRQLLKLRRLYTLHNVAFDVRNDSFGPLSKDGGDYPCATIVITIGVYKK